MGVADQLYLSIVRGHCFSVFILLVHKKEKKKEENLCVIILDLDHQPVDVKSSCAIGKDGRKKTKKKSTSQQRRFIHDLDFPF